MRRPEGWVNKGLGEKRALFNENPRDGLWGGLIIREYICSKTLDLRGDFPLEVRGQSNTITLSGSYDPKTELGRFT